jgi:plastocyanin
MPEGGILKRLMYAIPLSVIAVLVFAAIAAAQIQQTNQNKTVMQTPSSTTEPAEEPAETTVEIRNNAFNPPQLNVAPGTTVRFVNRDSVPHTVTADNKLFDSGELAPGASYPVVLDGAGTVTYHCELHPEIKGSIVVGKDGGAGDTTPQKQTTEVAPNSESSSEADRPAPEAAKNLKG